MNGTGHRSAIVIKQETKSLAAVAQLVAQALEHVVGERVEVDAARPAGRRCSAAASRCSVSTRDSVEMPNGVMSGGAGAGVGREALRASIETVVAGAGRGGGGANGAVGAAGSAAMAR